MITLPSLPAPNGCSPRVISFDLHARPATGAAVQTIYRPGSRWALDFSYPLMKADVARSFTSRLVRAQRDGLRMAVPLLGVSQGAPGTPQVDGVNPSGTVLPLKGCTPGYTFGEGYWLTLIDATGDYYLHQVVGSAIVNGSGKVTLSIETPIRAPIANSANVLVAAPMVQGFIEDVAWGMRLGNLIEGIGFTLEEAA
jgi:hypothetical protein